MKYFLLKILSLVFFFSVSVFALLFAYGYRVDFDEYSLRQTSIVDVVNEFDFVDVFFDKEKVSSVLPFQIKGVLPGVHKLEVRKYGFKPFVKNVFVRNDYVSIVYDVFLLPQNIDLYLKKIFLFDEDDVVVNGETFYLGYRVGDNVVHVVFVNDENFKFDDVKFHGKIDSVDVLNFGTRFLVRFDQDGEYAYVDLESKRIFSFSLPSSVYNVSVDFYGKHVLFIKDDSLFVVPVFELLQFKDDFELEFEKYLFKKNVTVYDLYDDKILFVMNDKLVMSDFDYKNVNLFNDVKYKNLRVFSGNGFAVLVIRTVDDKRLLKIICDDGVRFVSGDLYGNPFVSFNGGKIVFADDDGRVFVYDFYKDDIVFVGQFVVPFDILGMFFGDNYVLLKDVDGNFVLVDVDDGQRIILFENNFGYEKFISFDNAIFFLKDFKVILFDYDVVDE